VVYLNQKQSLRKEDVAIKAFEFDPVSKKARVQLENLGPNLGRVYQLTVANGNSVSQPGGGFPLLPRKRRWAEIGWEASAPPNRVVLRFSRFTLDTVLTPTQPLPAADPATGTPQP
jgi:hypothetical protein